MLFEFQYFVCKHHRLRSWGVLVPKRPFWRLWWNGREAAATVSAADGDVVLGPDRFVLVAPHTDFNVSLLELTEHMDVHFELSEPLGAAVSGLYTVSAAPELVEKLKEACALSKDDRRRQILLLTQVISGVFLQLSDDVWREPIADQRIVRVLRAMDAHLGETLSNRQFAEMAHMAPTAFIRRFKQVLGRSPQAYYLHKRLDQSCLLLETGDKSIERVAEECGFGDRSYFSTAFRKHFRISPAAFRRASRSR
ncbi:MAG: helix-turn-helix transcriptional regulator [Verrucomicrobia bacterium]|nr:helix-turn-helix transcriptional regulator [Verrucomicrobiota bacterium]